jgi:hypothetical protein
MKTHVTTAAVINQNLRFDPNLFYVAFMSKKNYY